MSEIIDYSKMTLKKFWTLVDEEGDAANETATRLFEKAKSTKLTQDEATECLNALFVDSHQRIRTHSKTLAKYYPTKQLTKNRLEREHLWWVDHFTAGISGWSTLNWFSSNKTQKSKKTGKPKYNGASAHFVLGHTGLPLYIIPLMHAAWHEPRRNKDSIAIEIVNTGGLRLHGGYWCYWPKDWKQRVPQALITALPPVTLAQKYKGHKAMQPFTLSQIANNIVLKRIVTAALPGKLDDSRMSQHEDWREGKSDMGPLWPYEKVNDSVFIPIPIEQLAFIQRYPDDVEIGVDLSEDDIDFAENPEYGVTTPTHDDDEDNDKPLLGTKEIQEILVRKGIKLDMDGKFGPKTKTAIKRFQNTWNTTHPDDMLKVDGIAGPATCNALQT